ncbi:hypothetical protein V8F20_010752 [Naviculisporaceae sp. PSN 640]
MSSPTTEELRQLTEQAQPFTSTTYRERRPSTFLSLAPNTSDSYPRTQKPKETSAAPLTADALKEQQQEQAAVGLPPKQHRTSSLSSDGSKTRLRFLKLGPVHWGEHQDAEHQGDWHEVAVE